MAHGFCDVSAVFYAYAMCVRLIGTNAVASLSFQSFNSNYYVSFLFFFYFCNGRVVAANGRNYVDFFVCLPQFFFSEFLFVRLRLCR